MKTNSIQQEILLMTNTSFSSRQGCEKNDSGKESQLSEKERLEEACWNGLLREMLSEICEKTPDAKMLTLWEIREGQSFLELELGEFKAAIDKSYSINPYLFLNMQYYN